MFLFSSHARIKKVESRQVHVNWSSPSKRELSSYPAGQSAKLSLKVNGSDCKIINITA